jgi:putative peptidoglycan lipid II flippase
MWPFLPLVALAAVAMGVLNTHRRFFVPALAPAFFNVVAVAGGLAMLAAGTPPEEAVVGWSVLVVAGGAAQLLVQVPSLRAVGWRGRPRFDLAFRDPDLRAVVKRMGPIALSLAGTNVMLLVTTGLASRGDGWAASLNYAFRLVHLPIGLVGVAIGTVLLAAGSRESAAGDAAALEGLQRQGLRLNWFLALPAAAGLLVLAEPLVRVIYERGRFGEGDTADVAAALRCYAGGIVFYAGVKAAAPQFLARGDTRTPMLCSLLGIALNLVLSLALVGSLGFRALALAVAAGAAANYGALRFGAGRRFGPGSAPGWGFLLRCGAASAVLAGLGAAASATLLARDAAVASGIAYAALTLAVVAALGAAYFVAAAALGVDEVAWVRRRLFGRRPPRNAS